MAFTLNTYFLINNKKYNTHGTNGACTGTTLLGLTRWDALFTLEKSHHKLWKLKENLARMEAKFIRICLSLPHPKFDEGWHLVLEKKEKKKLQHHPREDKSDCLWFSILLWTIWLCKATWRIVKIISEMIRQVWNNAHLFKRPCKKKVGALYSTHS